MVPGVHGTATKGEGWQELAKIETARSGLIGADPARLGPVL